jgi:hypothetical protein
MIWRSGLPVPASRVPAWHSTVLARQVRVDTRHRERHSVAEILLIMDEGSLHFLRFRDPADAVYVNRAFLTIAAPPQPGVRTIRLPNRMTVRDAFFGEIVCKEDDRFVVDLTPSQVRVLATGNVNPRAGR